MMLAAVAGCVGYRGTELLIGSLTAVVVGAGCFAVVVVLLTGKGRARWIRGLLVGAATIAAAITVYQVSGQVVVIHNNTNQVLALELRLGSMGEFTTQGKFPPGDYEFTVHMWRDIRPNLVVLKKLPAMSQPGELVSASEPADGYSVTRETNKDVYSFTVTTRSDPE
ncbi:MAG: hypothetical protein ACYC26_14495 [Phycisphaerales bacterium]